MFEKSDNNIRSNRNLYRNRDMIDNQLKENPQREENYKIQEHIIEMFLAEKLCANVASHEKFLPIG